jgi:predicted Fe-Mo cluster-binding NifX family protein
MNVCIPVDEDRGPESFVCAHFGAAPVFMIVDAESGACRPLRNRNQHHGHGRCVPLASIQGEQIDAVVVVGIGSGALNKLLAAGIQVYASDQPTVERTMAAWKAGSLRPVTLESACTHPGY